VVEMMGALAQFGVAGLIGWMWLSERRASGERERQIRETHEMLRQERTRLRTLVRIVAENTRALGALESTQRELAMALRAMGNVPHARGRAGA